jgi:tRNA A37 threonylcarbamoyladenosine dehydratase
MPVIIGQVDTEISMGGGSGAAAPGGGGQSVGAPTEVQVEELRATIREIIAEELERQLRRRMPER